MEIFRKKVSKTKKLLIGVAILAAAFIYIVANRDYLQYKWDKEDIPPSKNIIVLIDKKEAYPLSASFIKKELDILFKQLRDDQWQFNPDDGKTLNVDLTYKILLPGTGGNPSDLIEDSLNLHPGIGGNSWFIDTTKQATAQKIQLKAFLKSNDKYEKFQNQIDLANHPGGFAQESRILDEIDKITLSSNWRDPKVKTYFIIVSDLLECSPRPSGIPDFETINTDERKKAFEATGRIRPDFDPNRHQLVIFHIVKDGAPGSPIVNPYEFWKWYFSKDVKNSSYPSGAIRYYPISLNGRVSP